MDFRFDQDEREIVEQASRTLLRDLPASQLLEGARSDGWRSVGAAGWLHAHLEEKVGGAALELPVIAGIARAAGRVLAGDGFVNNAVLIPGLLAPADGAGDLLAAALEHPGFLLTDGRREHLSWDGSTPLTWCFGAERGMAGYRLDPSGEFERFGADDWELEPVGQLALGVGAVRLADGAASEPLGKVPPPDDELLRQAQVAHAAALVGLGERALEDTVAYVSERQQFGGAIGRFQAIKHALADVAVVLEIGWNAVLYAALRPDPTSVSIARLQSAEASEAAVRAMTQFFGGIAMTWEHHGHVYTKTALTGICRFGPRAEVARRIGLELVEEGTAR